MAFTERKRRSWAREEKELREDCKGSSGRVGKGLESRAQRSGDGTRVTEDPRWSGGQAGSRGEPDPGLARVWEGEGQEREHRASLVHAPLSATGCPSQVPGVPGAQRPGKEKTSNTAPTPRGEVPGPSTRVPRAPRGGEDPGRVRRSPGSRAGAARRQDGRRGRGGRRRSGGPWLRPGDRPRAAGGVAAAAVAARAPRSAAAWRGRPDPGRNRSPGAGTGPRPRRHLRARPRPGRPPRAGPPAAAATAGPAAANAAPAAASPAAPAERRLLPAS